MNFSLKFITVHDADPPLVVVKPDNFTVNETGEFLLFCEYDANPVSLQSVRWLQNHTVLNLNQSRFDGGNPELTALLVRNATREDSGTYVCELSNQVGTGMSEHGVVVDVQCEYAIIKYMNPYNLILNIFIFFLHSFACCMYNVITIKINQVY